MKEWSYFDKFEEITNKYLPACGEGDTMATQVVTAVNKLVYKWYNDGDVYDNSGYLKGWLNDLSSYANWLYQNIAVNEILERVWNCKDDGEYEDLLAALANYCLTDELLDVLAEKPKVGSIYECDGPFAFDISEDDEDEEEWW